MDLRIHGCLVNEANHKTGSTFGDGSPESPPCIRREGSKPSLREACSKRPFLTSWQGVRSLGPHRSHCAQRGPQRTQACSGRLADFEANIQIIESTFTTSTG